MCHKCVPEEERKTCRHVTLMARLQPVDAIVGFRVSLTPIPSVSSKVTFTAEGTSLPPSNEENCAIPRVLIEAFL